MATMRIGNFAMLDALRMIPESWTYGAEISANSNGCLAIVHDGYTFTLEGDGIVYVEKDDERKSYDDHDYYAHEPGKKFLEICKERFDKEVWYRIVWKQVKEMQNDAVEKIEQLYAMGVIDAENKLAMVRKLKSRDWFDEQFEKIVEEV